MVGNNMKPTAKLRFVERVDYVQLWGDTDMEHTALILQQWWETNNTVNLGFGGELPIGETKGEWRDVPIEKEQK
jgi:hypothetical protein